MMISVGESGRAVRILTNFDLSLSTDLVMKFTSPDGTIDFELNSSDGVIAPASDTAPLPPDNNFSGGVMPANHYMEYITDGAEFSVAGDWMVCVRYINSLSDPDDIYVSADSTYTILEAC